jgi:predicted permease
LVLLVGAGLFLRSLASLENVNPGFQPSGVITGSVVLPEAQYKDSAKQTAFYRSVIERLSSLPGVSAVAVGSPTPFSGEGGSASFRIEGRPSRPGDPGPHGDVALVTSNYFTALRIPIRRGRVFTDRDQPNTAPVALIDETLAREYWPNEDPIGKHITINTSEPWQTIVGVVGHTKKSDLAGDVVKGRYYFSLLQHPEPMATFLIRSQSDPARLAGAMKDAVRAVDPGLAVARIKVMSDLVSASLAPRRFVVTLLGIFAGLALLMAVIGLYGVISYSVGQRTQEIGIRVALGAQRSEVLKLVVGQGMQLTGVGLVIGLVASLAFSRLLRSQIYHVSVFDPLTFLVTALILVAAGALACYIPARRAMRVDPMIALRYE